MYFYGYRQHQPHAFVNKLSYIIYKIIMLLNSLNCTVSYTVTIIYSHCTSTGQQAYNTILPYKMNDYLPCVR